MTRYRRKHVGDGGVRCVSETRVKGFNLVVSDRWLFALLHASPGRPDRVQLTFCKINLSLVCEIASPDATANEKMRFTSNLSLSLSLSLPFTLLDENAGALVGSELAATRFVVERVSTCSFRPRRNLCAITVRFERGCPSPFSFVIEKYFSRYVILSPPQFISCLFTDIYISSVGLELACDFSDPLNRW